MEKIGGRHLTVLRRCISYLVRTCDTLECWIDRGGPQLTLVANGQQSRPCLMAIDRQKLLVAGGNVARSACEQPIEQRTALSRSIECLHVCINMDELQQKLSPWRQCDHVDGFHKDGSGACSPKGL